MENFQFETNTYVVAACLLGAVANTISMRQERKNTETRQPQREQMEKRFREQIEHHVKGTLHVSHDCFHTLRPCD
jgi:hypothetical protein